MDKEYDRRAAAFAYSLNLLNKLLKLNCITRDEYYRIAAYSAEFYGFEI